MVQWPVVSNRAPCMVHGPRGVTYSGRIIYFADMAGHHSLLIPKVMEGTP